MVRDGQAHLRKACIDDIPAMHRVRVAVRENRLSSPDRITPTDYEQALADGSGWVAESDDGIVGFAFGNRDGNVWALFVDPDHEGQGHGSALHDVLINWLEANASRPIWLSTESGTRAERFYRQHGWNDAGVLDSGERRFEWPRALNDSASGIRIRPLVHADAATLLRTVRGSMESLAYWFSWCSADYSLADAAARIAHCMNAREQDQEYAFAIVSNADTQLLGCVGLSEVKRAVDGTGGSANLGYWVAETQRGKGVATAAARMAARFGFDELGLSRIEIATLPHNHGSQRVAEKLGASHEPDSRRLIEFQGDSVASVVFGLTPGRLQRR
ncbi:MAG: GNAT family N-acetyltransferase [Lysobacteraceae bacterium]